MKTVAMKEAPAKSGPKPAPKFKNRRRSARELALQGIYQWRLTASEAGFIEAQLRSASFFARVDAVFFSDLLQGVIKHADELEQKIAPCLDRTFQELSPIELSILLLSTYELIYHPNIPYRPIINESIELAKTFGGTDGHKYINGVMDKLATQLRGTEVALHAKKTAKFH